MLERVVAELVASTEALALQQRADRKGKPVGFYFNVLVTTSQLQVAEFDAAHFSVGDGTLSNASFSEVPFVRFRKQFSPLGREISVFVVNVLSLEQFLREFWLDEEERAKYQEK